MTNKFLMTFFIQFALVTVMMTMKNFFCVYTCSGKFHESYLLFVFGVLRVSKSIEIAFKLSLLAEGLYKCF